MFLKKNLKFLNRNETNRLGKLNPKRVAGEGKTLELFNGVDGVLFLDEVEEDVAPARLERHALEIPESQEVRDQFALHEVVGEIPDLEVPRRWRVVRGIIADSTRSASESPGPRVETPTLLPESGLVRLSVVVVPSVPICSSSSSSSSCACASTKP
ncbi:hypothetical protein TIFTF001_039742 [Ficus carica]|uniref:Uncharacterized protein n=1 Tax=Ficus carica TaxID=3494 RepID=A0AA87Z5G3_FICCA|nr:hypothetical protein TIFTF001_039742 [Ficus carica]